ncbi:putative peptidoglycan lipid II flippase [Trueperella bonasi]|uniref:Peptidoglycan lipid II flippase n=1 Tax=Trueperella bonasi TaxID=312286 RepID=A0ABT9NFD6_9ACTO|nr:lipid II flippase MurJ [Trueperella bonasi]MDP9805563.1 putative peptidoglycan lipid II flippase [Trueperella bonasi]
MRPVKVLAGTAGMVAVLTLASRLMGLVRKLAQSWALSDGQVATAYDTANTVPNVLFEVAAGGALAGAIIPLISRYLSKGRHAQADQTASALLTWIALIGIPVAVLLVIFSAPLAKVLLPQATPELLWLTTIFLRIFAVQVPLYGVSVVATGILQSHGKFVLPALSPLLSSVAVTAAFLGYSNLADPFVDPGSLSWGAIALLGWGTTAGVAVFSLPQLFIAGRHAKLRPTLTFPEGAGREVVRLGFAGLAALLAQQIAIVVIMVTANGLGGTGTYAAFNYAYAMFMVPYAVLAVPIATVVFPQLSAASGERLMVLTSRSTRLVFAMGALSAVLLFVLAEPAKVVLELGRDISGLDTAMRAMAPGLIGFSLLYHGARVLYAQNAPGLVILCNSLSWASVVIVLGCAYVIGVSGRQETLVAIGLSLSIGLSIGGVLVLAAIRRQLGSSALQGIARLATALLPTLFIVGLAVEWIVERILAGGGASIASAFGAAMIGALLLLSATALCVLMTDRQLIRRPFSDSVER